MSLRAGFDVSWCEVFNSSHKDTERKNLSVSKEQDVVLRYFYSILPPMQVTMLPTVMIVD